MLVANSRCRGRPRTGRTGIDRKSGRNRVAIKHLDGLQRVLVEIFPEPISLESLRDVPAVKEMELLRRAPVGESVVVTGLELTGFITGAAKVGAFEVGVFDVTLLIPPD